MNETKVVIGVACISSLLAVLSTLIVVPQLYMQINQLNDRVHDGVQVRGYFFRNDLKIISLIRHFV